MSKKPHHHGPQLTKLAKTLPASVPFVGPEAQERQRKKAFRARLGANENVFGPSPKAIAAMEAASRDAWMYGDPESHDLRQALAAHHGVPTENIMIGEGIDALLGYLVRLMIEPGNTVVTSAGAYPTFNYHVAGYGGTLIEAPYRDDHEDPDALIEAATESSARLIYLANPDNPMGTWHSAERINGMVERVPEGSLLILDEAYVEMAPSGTAPDFVPDDPRVIRMRTFSKAYGLAGARIGYAIGERNLIQAFNKVRNHFAMSRVSQAGALVALEDQSYLQATLARIANSRAAIAAIAEANGLSAIPSATNFVAIDCGRDGTFAQAVLEGLINQGVFVRKPFVAPEDRAIRLSCGTPEQLDVFAEALPLALAAASKSA